MLKSINKTLFGAALIGVSFRIACLCRNDDQRAFHGAGRL